MDLSHVLVVDESVRFASAMRRALESQVSQVQTASRLEEALALIRAGEPQLVVADVQLPDGDGFELLEAMSEPDRCLLLTSHRTTVDARRAHRLGALDYLTKPVTLKAVQAAWQSRGDTESREAPRIARPALGYALLGERDADIGLCWEIGDLSENGAFLLSGGPVAPGRVIPLRLQVEPYAIAVVAEVVRVQPPSWNERAGIGVRIDPVDDAERIVLQKALRALRY